MKWLRRSLFVIAGLCLLIVMFGWWALGTETGTRWLIRQATDRAPVDVAVGRVTGTFAGELRIADVRVVLPGRQIAATELIVDLDWSGSSLATIGVERLAAGQVRIETSAASAPRDEPFEISMGALPIDIGVAAVELGALQFNDTALSNISVTDFSAVARRFGAAAIGLTVDRLELDAQDVSINVEDDVPVSAIIDWRLADSGWSGTAGIGGSLRRLELTHGLSGDYPATSAGSVFILGEVAPSIDITSTFAEWRYQDWIARDASVRIRGTADDYRADLSGEVERPEVVTAALSGMVTGDRQALRSIDLSATTPLADAQVAGSVAWSPALAVDLSILATNIDPSAFVAVAAGKFDAEVRLVATGAEDFALDIVSLTGTYNDLPANARARVVRDKDVWTCAACRLRVGDNRLDVEGRLSGSRLSVQVAADAPSIDQLLPGIAGAVEVEGRLGGTLALPILSGNANARGLAVAGWGVEAFSVRSRSSTPERVDVDVSFDGLRRGETGLGRGSVQLSGELDAIELDAGWSRDELAVTARASLSIADDVVRGRILSAALTEPYTGTWQSSLPFGFEAGPGEIRIDATTWTNGDARLRQEPIVLAGDEARLAATLTNGPLTAFNAHLPPVVRVVGLVDADLSLQRTGDQWTGALDWRQRRTRIVLLPADDNALEFQVRVARAQATFGAAGATVQAVIDAEPGMRIDFDATLDELSAEGMLDARMRVEGNDWRWIGTLVPEVDGFGGELSSDLSASGRVTAPDLRGSLHWQDGRVVIPALNLPLTNIDLTLQGSSAGSLTVAGEASSGEGRLGVDGRVVDITSASPEVELRLSGDRAAVLGWEDFRLTASPDLSIAASEAGVRVTGRVTMDKGEIRVTELQEGAVTPSADVIVEGRDAEQRRETRVSGDVTLTLSDSIHVQAFGLDTNVAGELRFVLATDREPRAEGELNLVGGFFETYGQRLEIERGTMLFTGPLDNPFIDARAVRVIDGEAQTITVGIELRGRAENLGATIFSEPAMAEAEALSYLLTGRPLASAGASEGNLLSNAAYSLGLRQAGLITNQIGQSVGLDELNVSGSNQNTMALVAGKQINSNLYARYSYGVFNRLGELLLRYRLSDSVAIELGAGETQSMDILYTIERE